MLYKKEEHLSSQTLREEIANAVTHGFGFICSVLGCISLIYYSIKEGSAWHVVSSSCYGGSLVATYTTSTLYHVCRNKAKEVLQRLDHISIYLLITGTYMPITLLVLKGSVGWTLFGFECSLCFIGVIFKAVYGHRYAALSGAFYLLMGWLAIFAIEPIIKALPSYGPAWLLAGGIFYTLGFIFFALDKKYHYFHTIWHLFVLAGSFAHFYLISYYVIAFAA